MVVGADQHCCEEDQTGVQGEKGITRLFVKVSFSNRTKMHLRNALKLRREAWEGAEVWIEITALLHGQ